ncbi:MAG: addiction module toxin RelE [Chloroflexi bacterium]|nr:MAG: addiction module toxin RelE [Chloroflexota bacterium]
MKPPSRYEIIYAPVVKGHIRAIEKRFHSLIRRTIEEQLAFEPLVETRNRKPLKRPAWFGATWEIRFGPNNRFRVFYRADPKGRRVLVLAVGEKRGNRLKIGGEEIEI